MKRTLCLFLALILAVGICFSAPVTITASAAFTLESGTEHTVGAVYIDSTTGVKFKITDIETKQVEVCGYSNLKQYLVIPATVNISENGGGTLAYSVTAIGASAFANCDSLYSVVIPEGVITIGEDAFYYCDNLRGVTIPESVTSIGARAFSVISPIANVSVPCKWYEKPLYTFSDYFDITVTIADHAYKDGVCEACGYECPGHTYEFAICTNCSYVCHHETVTNGVCEVCGGTYCGKTESDTVVCFYNESTKTLTISGEGEMADFTDTTMPWYSYRSEIATIVINKGVTSIGAYSFYKCTALTSVTIPESVTSIGAYSFYKCTALPSVTIPESITSIGSYAFSYCSELPRVTIPNSVTTIDEGVFYGCESLTTIKIPNSVTTIDSAAFNGCTSLTTVTIPSSVTTIESYTFNGCTSLTTVTIPSSVTEIGSRAFSGCISLTTVTIPSSVTEIGSRAFSGCTSLTTVTIPSSVTTIESYAFNGCTSLTTIEIPDSVTTIGSNAFNGCTSLTTLEIPDSVTTIGANAFNNCTKLTTVSVPCSWNEKPLYTFEDGVAVNIERHTIENNACTVCKGSKCGATESDTVAWFYDEGTLYINGTGGMTTTAPWKNYKSEIKTVVIGSGVTTIGNSAFSGCTALATVTIGKGVTTIGEYAFYNCTFLTTIEIPDSVTTIDYGAFYNCTALESVTIGSGVTTIGNSAFSGCTALATVTIGKGVTTIGNDAFYGCTSLTTVNVPCDWDENTYAFGGGVEINYRHIYKNGKCIGDGCVISCSHETITDGVCTVCDGKHCGKTENDKVVWFYDEDTTILTITGSGDMAKFDSRDMLPPWANYRDSIKKVVISDGVTNIANYAFYNCTALKDITIGKNVATIDYSAFLGCSALESITVDENNASYLSEDGILFSKDKTKIIRYPQGKAGEYNIPKGVKTIGVYAFRDCALLTSVTIPEGVTTIEECAFFKCTSISTITIPEGVTSVGNSVFLGCEKLETITLPYSLKEIGTFAFGVNAEWISEVNVPCSWNDEVFYTDFKDGVLKIPPHEMENSVCKNCGNDCIHPEYKYGICTTEGCGYACAHETITDGVCVTCGGKHCGNTKNDKVVWFYDEDTTILTITGSDDLAGYTIGGAPWEAYRESIRGIDIKDGVTSIGIGTFCGCVSLTSVIIPGSVKIIGDNAFSGCESLSNVRISEGVISIGNYAFQNCTLLKEITIPESVTEIGERAFFTCQNLMTITIPKNVTVIGEGAFCNCTRLTEINVDEGNTTYSSEDGVLFNEGKTELICCPAGKVGDYEVPSGVTSISNYAFSSRGEIFTVTIPVSVTTIGDYAFAGSQYVNLIVEPGSYAHEFATTNSIPYTFNGYTEAETDQIEKLLFTLNADSESYSVTFCDAHISGALNIPATYNGKPVTEIGNNAFRDCIELTSVTIGEGVTIIGDSAFDSCESLTLVTIPDSVTTIGRYAFNCTSLTSVTIPDSIKEIYAYAFENCTELTSVTIGNGVTEIDDYAFYGCNNLSTVNVPCDWDTENPPYAFDENALEKYHNIVIDEAKAPTCTETGLTEGQHCTRCDAMTIIQEEVPALNHKDTLVQVEAKAPTCEAIGWDAYEHCTECDYTTYKEKAKLGHDKVSHSAKSATCEAIGWYAYDTCSRCDYTTYKEIAKLGHDKVSHSAKSATCEAIGWYAYDTCSRCDYTTYKEIAKLGHDIVIDKAVEATCTKTGLTEGSHCTRCDDKTVAQQTIAKKAHTEVTVTGKAATCTETGLTDGKKCSVCGATTVAQQTIAKKGHTEVTVTGKAATCTATGLTDGKKCSVCGVTTVEQKVIDALGHDFSKNFTVDKEATYNETGSKSKHCSRCDAKTEVTAIAKKVLATPTVSFTPTAKGFEINWNKVEGAQSYIVYKKTYNANTRKWSGWSRLKSGVTSTSCTDTSVKLGSYYKYTVKAVNGKATSTFVNLNGKKYNVTPDVKVAIASNGIKVSWSTAANATGYRVYSSTYNTKTKKWSGWTNRGTTKANATSWVDKKAKSGTKYRYTIKAMNDKVGSTYNKDGAATLYLAQPTVKIANNASGVKVAWNKIAGATGYTIYRAEYKNGKWSGWKNMGTIKKNSTVSWVDKSANSGTQYRYTVRAINGSVKSTYKASNTLLYLAQPTVTVKAVSNGINVAWSQCEGATGYTVYRSEYNTKTKKWSSWKSRGTAKATKSNWTDTKTTKGVIYKYTVRSVNADTGAKSSYVASKNVKR